jgi:hypothetical protein
MASKNDKLILTLKKEIEQKKNLLTKSQKFIPKTNCSLTIFGNILNLHVANKEDLLKAIANVKSLEIGLHSCLPGETLTIGGYSSKEWLEDLINKFNNLNLSLERTRLKTLEEKLYNLLSTDTKVSLEIEDIKNSI